MCSHHPCVHTRMRQWMGRAQLEGRRLCTHGDQPCAHAKQDCPTFVHGCFPARTIRTWVHNQPCVHGKAGYPMCVHGVTIFHSCTDMLIRAWGAQEQNPFAHGYIINHACMGHEAVRCVRMECHSCTDMPICAWVHKSKIHLHTDAYQRVCMEFENVSIRAWMPPIHAWMRTSTAHSHTSLPHSCTHAHGLCMGHMVARFRGPSAFRSSGSSCCPCGTERCTRGRASCSCTTLWYTGPCSCRRPCLVHQRVTGSASRHEG